MSPLTNVSAEFNRVAMDDIKRISTILEMFVKELPRPYFHTVCSIEIIQPIMVEFDDVKATIVYEDSKPSRIMSSVADKLYYISYQLSNIKTDIENNIEVEE
jgi:hypothetical protein